MKKILLIILSITLVFCLFGCVNDEYHLERYYGLVRWSEENNQLVVYIPDIGEVEIPESECCRAGFEGYEGNEYSYELKAGDFVAINFEFKKGWDENSVKIMETNPARFNRKASMIEAVYQNISFIKTDNGYELSFSLSDHEIEINTGDAVYFEYHSGKNGVAYIQLVANGTVVDISDGKAIVDLNLLVTEKEFFEKFTSITIELNGEAWENIL